MGFQRHRRLPPPQPRRRQSTTRAMTSDGNWVRVNEPPLRSLNCLAQGSVRLVLQNPLRPSGHGMRVMSEVTNPLAREHTMTKVQGKDAIIELKEQLRGDPDFLRGAVQAAVEAALEAEMTEVLGAAKSERTEAPLGYRSGYYHRSLVTRVGVL